MIHSTTRLEAVSRLDDTDLGRLADLERRVVEADGGRLKLEWRTLRSRRSDDVSDFLLRQGGALIGFAGLYSFGGAVEVTGMIDPARRRRGLGSALLDAARSACRRRGIERALLVAPRTTGAGECFARHHGGIFDHSEHALRLAAADLTVQPVDPALSVRPARPADAPGLAALLCAAFGLPLPDPLPSYEHTTVIEVGGDLVATVRVERLGAEAGIYGFAVDPARQGRGLGRAVLVRVCDDLRRAGVEQIALEVAVENERALRLYTSLGFRPHVTEDYWAVSSAGA